MPASAAETASSVVRSRDIDRGAQHPGAQQALAHRSEGVVEGAEERYGVSGAGKEGLDQLQVADGDGVKDEAVLALIVTDAVDVASEPRWVWRM